MITQLRRDVCYEEDIGWGRSVGEPQRLLETCPRGGHSGCRCSEVGVWLVCFGIREAKVTAGSKREGEDNGRGEQGERGSNLVGASQALGFYSKGDGRELGRDSCQGWQDLNSMFSFNVLLWKFKNIYKMERIVERIPTYSPPDSTISVLLYLLHSESVYLSILSSIHLSIIYRKCYYLEQSEVHSRTG